MRFKGNYAMKGLMIFKWIVLGVLMVALVGFITMSLWNWLVPALFSGPVITFWQALGLLILSKLLFWGFGGKKHHGGGPGFGWKQRYYDKLSNMTPEERQAFKEKMRTKWCPPARSDSGEKSAASND